MFLRQNNDIRNRNVKQYFLTLNLSIDTFKNTIYPKRAFQFVLKDGYPKCGRFAMTNPIPDIIEQFEIADNLFGQDNPRFNIAPGQEIAAIYSGPHCQHKKNQIFV